MPCCLALLAYCLCKYLDTLTVSLAEFPPLPCLPDMNACLFFQTQLSLCDAAVLSRSVVSDFFATPWTVAHQAPLPMGFSRQEYWSGLPCPPPRDLPNPGLPHCRQILSCLSHQGRTRGCRRPHLAVGTPAQCPFGANLGPWSEAVSDNQSIRLPLLKDSGGLRRVNVLNFLKILDKSPCAISPLCKYFCCS